MVDPKKKKRSIAIMPRPVHPRPVCQHGLFGMSYVNQHWMTDGGWMPNSLIEEFKGMGEFLAKRMEYSKLENQAARKRHIKESRNLRRQCRDGRSKLQMVLRGYSSLKIRNFLINHKDKQRLYQKLPVHQVLDKINQSTFVMRKERDRLTYDLRRLKNRYSAQLIVKGDLENRIKYQNEFELEEQKKAMAFSKRIKNSEIRLKAVKTINSTYQKMIQILRHDAIFYEPILRSLTLDTMDQTTFIKHILFLGQPAIETFKDLSEEYRLLEDKNRRSIVHKIMSMQNYRAVSEKGPAQFVRNAKTGDVLASAKQYVRETPSMLHLKHDLEVIENTIKRVKTATLCYKAEEIYPRLKLQVENNHKLKKINQNGKLGFQALGTKMQRAEVLSSVMIHNLNEEELERMKTIKKLEKSIAAEDSKEADIMRHMKDSAVCYAMMRFSLWKLSDILSYVDRPPKIGRHKYRSSYLKLPLLKFEMLTMRACAPEPFDTDLDNVMKHVKHKVEKLMAFTRYMERRQTKVVDYRGEYINAFLESVAVDSDGEDKEDDKLEEEEIFTDTRIYHNVPSRKQLKAISARLVEEEIAKKET